MKDRVLFLDCETSSLDAKEGALLQVYAEIPSLGVNINLNMRPHEGAHIDPKALEINGLTEEEIWARPLTIQQGCIQLKQFVYDNLKKPATTCAYRSVFDNEFVRSLFRRCKTPFWRTFKGIWIDPMHVALFLVNRGVITQPKNFKLKVLAEHLGIEVDESRLHEAGYDIYLTIKIFSILNRLVDPIKLDK